MQKGDIVKYDDGQRSAFVGAVTAIGTLLAFKLAEGILYTGHAVIKRACKRMESKLNQGANK